MRLNTRARIPLALLAGTLLLAGCGGTSSTTSSNTQPEAGTAEQGDEIVSEVTPLVLGAVPSLDLGLIEVGNQLGVFEAAGVSIEIVPVDSGPNVVTGVVAGQYDIGATAYAPPLLALAEGAPLVQIVGAGTVGPSGSNGGLLVREDSGFTTWKDLAGKKIASNAPRSLFSLTVPAAIAADGGDASTIEIIPLPFNQIPKAVAEGQVDAGVVLEPFLTNGLTEYPDLINLGDSIRGVLPEGSATSLYFTSAKTAEEKGVAIERFKQAIVEVMAYANENYDEVKAAGAPLAGLTAKQAAGLPDSTYKPNISSTDLQPLLELMVQFGWIKQAPDLTTFIP